MGKFVFFLDLVIYHFFLQNSKDALFYNSQHHADQIYIVMLVKLLFITILCPKFRFLPF